MNTPPDAADRSARVAPRLPRRVLLGLERTTRTTDHRGARDHRSAHDEQTTIVVAAVGDPQTSRPWSSSWSARPVSPTPWAATARSRCSHRPTTPSRKVDAATLEALAADPTGDSPMC